MLKEIEKFSPGIQIRPGLVYYPTGNEWILLFAYAGCQWAIDIIKKEVGEEWERIAARIASL